MKQNASVFNREFWSLVLHTDISVNSHDCMHQPLSFRSPGDNYFQLTYDLQTQ